VDLNNYRNGIRDFAVYPDARTGKLLEIMYLSLGLAGEVGEVLNKVKKLFRDGDSADKRAELRKELGDVFWYLVRLCDTLSFDIDLILEQNYNKLNDRKQRGVIGGSGDSR